LFLVDKENLLGLKRIVCKALDKLLGGKNVYRKFIF